MPLSGNYDAESQKPKYAIPGGAVDKRYIYAAAPGWTQRRFKSANGSEFYDEVLETKTLYTDATRTTVVTTPINGTGAAYPSIGGAYAITLVGGGTGYTSGVKATTGGTGTGLTVDVTVSGGVVTSATIVNYGSGYTDGDTITISGGTISATATIRV